MTTTLRPTATTAPPLALVGLGPAGAHPRGHRRRAGGGRRRVRDRPARTARSGDRRRLGNAPPAGPDRPGHRRDRGLAARRRRPRPVRQGRHRQQDRSARPAQGAIAAGVWAALALVQLLFELANVLGASRWPRRCRRRSSRRTPTRSATTRALLFMALLAPCRVHRRHHDRHHRIRRDLAARGRGRAVAASPGRARRRARRPRPRHHRRSGARRGRRAVDRRAGRPRRARCPARHARWLRPCAGSPPSPSPRSCSWPRAAPPTPTPGWTRRRSCSRTGYGQLLHHQDPADRGARRARLDASAGASSTARPHLTDRSCSPGSRGSSSWSWPIAIGLGRGAGVERAAARRGAAPHLRREPAGLPVSAAADRRRTWRSASASTRCSSPRRSSPRRCTSPASSGSRRRGDAWPWLRTVSWLLGLAVVIWCTNAGISVYAQVSVGLHMLQHMTLTMLGPIFLVLGAPATLALRALRPAVGNERGPREWLVWFLHSWITRLLTNPFYVFFVYVIGLYGLYFTPAFGWLMGSHVGHVLMQVHFIVSGYLFYWILIGIDPRPKPLPYWARLLMLLLALSVHGFFAVALMMGTQPLAVEWYGTRAAAVDHRPAARHPRRRARWRGGLSEIPSLIVLIVIAVQWARSDDREAARTRPAGRPRRRRRAAGLQRPAGGPGPPRRRTPAPPPCRAERRDDAPGRVRRGASAHHSPRVRWASSDRGCDTLGGMRTRALALSVAALATVSLGLAGCSSSDAGTAPASPPRAGAGRARRRPQRSRARRCRALRRGRRQPRRDDRRRAHPRGVRGRAHRGCRQLQRRGPRLRRADRRPRPRRHLRRLLPQRQPLAGGRGRHVAGAASPASTNSRAASSAGKRPGCRPSSSRTLAAAGLYGRRQGRTYR